jgi:sugar (pentulose or hexulose) kinase
MSDGCASQIAAGALSPGAWNCVLGTTLVLKGVSADLITDPDGAVYSHRHPDEGWLPGGASNVGAGALNQEFGGRDLDALSAKAQAYEPAPGVIYPLTAQGERFPFVRAGATRFEVGDLEGDGVRFAALLQGVAYVERLCFDHLASIGADVSGDVAITGGATRSMYWNQVRSDVLGRPLVVPANPEAAFGMAVLASAAAERSEQVSVAGRAASMVSRRALVEPRWQLHKAFSEKYESMVGELVRRGYIGGRP